MRKFLALILVLFTFFLQAQRFTISKRKCIENLKKETLLVPTGYGKAFDDAMKAAIEKYWTLCKVKYVNKEKLSGDCYIYIQEHSEEHGISSNYHVCEFMGFDASKAGIFGYQLYFDNDHHQKHPEEISGIDKNYDDMAHKITQFVMALCFELKRLETEEVAKYTTHNGNEKDKLKSYKILIPQEYLNVGISKDCFTTKLTSCEFMKSSDIHAKVATQKDTESYAELLLSKTYGQLRIYFIDLKTGQLIYYDSVSGGVDKSGPIETKNVERVLKSL